MTLRSSRPHHLWIALNLLLATLSCAQSVRWEPAGGTLAEGRTSALALIFTDCEPVEDFQRPAVAGLAMDDPQRSEQSSTQIINGRVTSSQNVSLVFPVRPTTQGSIVIPAFAAKTSKGPVNVAAARFDVVAPTVGGTNMPLSDAARSTLAVKNPVPVWAGQVVDVEYTFNLSSRFNARLASYPTWDAAPLTLEGWQQAEEFSAMVDGEARQFVRYKARASVGQPGKVDLNPVSQLVNIRAPSPGRNIFQPFQVEQFEIKSNPLSLEIKPLPANAPRSFAGGVGHFVLQSTIVPEDAAVGDPITWTLKLSGTGNWPEIRGLPKRQVSAGFKVVQPDPKREPAPNALFEATLTEDVVLIPTQPGTYQLGAIEWSYFDPADGQYHTERTEPVTLTIKPAANATPTANSANAAQTPPTGPAAKLPELPQAKAPPELAPLPPGTLAAADAGRAPRPTAITPRWGLLLGLGLGALWLALALLRAWLRDPRQPARRALKRLRRTIPLINTESRAALLTWQKDSLVYLGIAAAEPSAATLGRIDPSWGQLWREAEVALYAQHPQLPADWAVRASAALKQGPSTLFRPWRALMLRNLLPALALALLSVALVPAANAAQATDPAEAYQQGKFAIAESGWRRAVDEGQQDWAAHYNLSLALAQQDRWAEASGHATAAWLQNPAHETLRWQFKLSLSRAGVAPPLLSALANPRGVHKYLVTASVPQWQDCFRGSLGGMVAALALALILAYAGFRRSALVVFLLTLLIGGSALLASGFALKAYGILTDPQVALVTKPGKLSSVPTDADTSQQTTPIAAGTLAIVDHTFLGWVQLRFPDGNTGWVRKETITPLWQ